nr:atherin-like [Aegilops tauschii subsp. strangulata]
MPRSFPAVIPFDYTEEPASERLHRRLIPPLSRRTPSTTSALAGLPEHAAIPYRPAVSTASIPLSSFSRLAAEGTTRDLPQPALPAHALAVPTASMLLLLRPPRRHAPAAARTPLQPPHSAACNPPPPGPCLAPPLLDPAGRWPRPCAYLHPRPPQVAATLAPRSPSARAARAGQSLRGAPPAGSPLLLPCPCTSP